MNAPRVLLVEDNEVNRYLAQFVLERAGFAVETANDGLAAIAAAQRTRPDLILLDLRMPVLDGYETVRRLKADPALAGIVVVALSAQVMPQERERALALGCAAHLEKPIDVVRFPEQVRALLPASSG